MANHYFTLHGMGPLLEAHPGCLARIDSTKSHLHLTSLKPALLEIFHISMCVTKYY